jgi:hypothetical protein
MHTTSLIFNDNGKSFVSIKKKVVYYFKFFYLFTVISAVIVVFLTFGVSLQAFLSFSMMMLVFFFVMNKSYIQPKKIIESLIDRIEFTENDIHYSNGEALIIPNKVYAKNELQIFDTKIEKYLILESGSKKYYIIPDFFDDFTLIENRIGAIE